MEEASSPKDERKDADQTTPLNNLQQQQQDSSSTVNQEQQQFDPPQHSSSSSSSSSSLVGDATNQETSQATTTSNTETTTTNNTTIDCQVANLTSFSNNDNNVSNNESAPTIDCRDAEISAQLRWTPGVPDCDLMMYLRAARSMAAFAGMCDGGNFPDDCNPATRDDTTINALDLLHECNYDISEALQALVKNPIPIGIDKKWSADEQKRFIRAVNKKQKCDKVEKNFFKIRNEVLPNKKVSELVEFYYLFKKTSLFNGSRGKDKRRRPPSSKVKPTKSTASRENTLETGDPSSDESGDGSNDNEENRRRIQNNDVTRALENALNSPNSGDQTAEASSRGADASSKDACNLSKLKHETRSPSIMQRSQKSDEIKLDLHHRNEVDAQTKMELCVKQEADTSSSAEMNKSIKEELTGLGDSASPEDRSPRTSPQRSSLPDEKLPKPTQFRNQSFSANTHSPNKNNRENDSSLPDNQRSSPAHTSSKPADLSALPTGCSSLAQFTDSIGQPSPNAQRSSPNSNEQGQQNGPGQTSCASLAQLTERIGQPSPTNNSTRPPQSTPSSLPPNLGQLPGLPGLPANMPYGLPYWSYGQPARPGQPPLSLPPLFPGIPGFPGFPPLSPLNPANSSPAKVSNMKNNSSGSGQSRATANISSPIGGVHNQSGGPNQSPHQQTSSSLASPSSHVTSSPNKIRTQNAIFTRVIQRPDGITCARTDWTFKPQKTDVEWYRRCQERKRKSDKEHSEPKKLSMDRDPHHSTSQHQQHSHSQQQMQQNQQSSMGHPGAQQPMSNFMPQHHMQSRERDLPGPPPSMPGMPDPSHLLHSFPNAGSLDRPQSSRYLDNPPMVPFGFRNSPGDLTRPHTAFSPAGFPPRGTPTSLPSSTPNFLQGAGFPGIPPALEAIFMQYQLYNERLANANANNLDFETQRRLFQHPGFPDASSGGPPGPGGGGLPPPMLHNPSSPNPAALAGLIFPPGSDGRDQFNERLGQPDFTRLPLRQNPDFYQAYAAAMSQLGNVRDQPGGVGGQGSVPGGHNSLGLPPPPPPHSQADSINFPGGPDVRPMMPGRDHFFNPQRYASYGSPYGVPPSPFFGLGGPPAP